jgi:hypothetical protein
VQIIRKIGAVRTALLNRRTERVERRRLADELASFVTPAERAELDFIISRHTAEETRVIRQILAGQQVARQYAHTAGLYRGR